MSTASHNSNDSMPDDTMEVIGPEDFEDSPPSTDVEVIGEVKDSNEARNNSIPDVEDITPTNEKESKMAAGDTEAVGSVVEDVSQAEDPPKETLSSPPAAEAVLPPVAEAGIPPFAEAGAPPPPVDDDPPLEILQAPRVEPIPPPVVQPQPPPQVVATRPTVTPARPAATLEEEDDEEDDDDIDETLAERLVGLTEMFPQFIRTGSVKLVKNSWVFSQASFSFAKAATWVVFSTATILFMPVMIESERLQLQDQQKAQKNQILLGPGVAQSGGPSLGPPPI